MSGAQLQWYCIRYWNHYINLTFNIFHLSSYFFNLLIFWLRSAVITEEENIFNNSAPSEINRSLSLLVISMFLFDSLTRSIQYIDSFVSFLHVFSL